MNVPNIVQFVSFYYRRCDCDGTCQNTIAGLPPIPTTLYRACDMPKTAMPTIYAIDMVLRNYPNGNLDDFMISKNKQLIDNFRNNSTANYLLEMQKNIDKGLINIYHAIVGMHKVSVLHFDIKPANIYIGKLYDFNVGDFGSARHLVTILEFFKSNRELLYSGTPSFIPPEYAFLQSPNSDDLRNIISKLSDQAKRLGIMATTISLKELAKFDYYALGVTIFIILFFYLFGIPFDSSKIIFTGNTDQRLKNIIGTSAKDPSKPMTQNDIQALKSKVNKKLSLLGDNLQEAKSLLESKLKRQLTDNDKAYIQHYAICMIIFELINKNELTIYGFIEIMKDINDPYFKNVNISFVVKLLQMVNEMISDASKRSILRLEDAVKFQQAKSTFQQTAGDPYYHKYLKYKKKYLALKARLSQPRTSSL